jgi:hypothetical protein
MKYQTATLEGERLDAAVAKAKGWKRQECDGDDWWWGCKPQWRYSTGNAEVRVRLFKPSSCWVDAGPILESMVCDLASVLRDYGRRLDWYCGVQINGERVVYEGETALVAAMRAFVAQVLGEEVDL